MSKSDKEKKIGELEGITKEIELIGIHNPFSYRLLNIKEVELEKKLTDAIKKVSIEVLTERLKELESE